MVPLIGVLIFVSLQSCMVDTAFFVLSLDVPIRYASFCSEPVYCLFLNTQSHDVPLPVELSPLLPIVAVLNALPFFGPHM